MATTGMLNTIPQAGGKHWFNLDLYNQELQRRLQGVGTEGRVFKSWDMFSDGIGSTANDFIKARPDIFGYDAALGSRQIGSKDNSENPTTNNYWDFGAANDILKNYETRRLGQDGVKDGRRDVIVDKRTGEVVYAGMNHYSYNPAKTNLKDAVTFIGGALGGYMGVNALASLFGTGGGAGAAAGAAEGAAGTAGAAGSAGGGMLTNGAFLGEGVASGVGAWDAAMAGADAFSSVLSLTGSEALASAASGVAKAASTGADWLSSTWSAITGGGAGSAAAGAAKSAIGSYFSGSSVLRDLLPIIGAGVNQATAEKMVKDQRNWQSAEKQKDRDFEEKKASDTRRRQMPTTGPGLLGKFRVIPGAGNGG